MSGISLRSAFSTMTCAAKKHERTCCESVHGPCKVEHLPGFYRDTCHEFFELLPDAFLQTPRRYLSEHVGNATLLSMFMSSLAAKTLT